MAVIKQGVLVSALLLTMGCQAQLAVPQTWESPLYADGQLVGKIWDSNRDQFIDQQQLIQRINDSRYLLLGEKHDNPDHHALQKTMLDYYLQQQRVGSVAFEMMESDKQELLDEIANIEFSGLDQIRNYLQWDEEGWDWPFYGPLIESSYNAGVGISAGNITSEFMGQVYGGGLPAGAVDVLDETVIEKLNAGIDESHCGMLPESQFPAMVRVQQARDFSMAGSVSAKESSGKLNVLIAGNFHVRQDLGVPNYLLAADDTLNRNQIVSLSFQEVDSSELSPQEYLQQFNEVKAFDFIWFTPAISNEDYCASLRGEV